MADNKKEIEIKGIAEDLEKRGKMLFLEGAKEEQIAEFEKTNNIILPQQYKKWLMFSDGGVLYIPAGIQLYGVAHKPIINISDDDRPSDDYVVIGALATGDPIMFKKGSEQVFIYNREEEKIEDDEIYEDFITFLNDLYDLLGIGE